MDITDWTLLKILYEAKSTSRAAEKAHLTQPGVMYRINRMEQEMGVRLFVRNAKGIQFNSAGMRLLSYADRMLFQNNQIKNYVRNSPEELSGELEIGSSQSGINYFLSPIIRKFRAEHPLVKFNIRCDLNDNLMDKLLHEELMLSIVKGDYPWDYESIIIAQEPLVIISSEPINEDYLFNTPLILYQKGSRLTPKIRAWYKKSFGREPTINLNVDNGPQSCIRLVKESLGWAVVPASHVRDSSLFTEAVYDDGIPFLHPTRLLYYDYLRDFDEYLVFIDFVQSLFPEKGELIGSQFLPDTLVKEFEA